MSHIKNYVCSQSNCDETFIKYVDLKKHEAKHSANAHYCPFPGCDFATLTTTSLNIHYAKHTGEQRYVCPDCPFRTHDPSALTRHRQSKHGYVAGPRFGVRHPAVTPSASSSSQPSAPSPSYQYQYHANIQNPSYSVFYDPGDTSEDYTMFTEPARTADGWTEGCMCPELMERRPSELLGYVYRPY
ncbi:hypothetical protein DEU56DRAFT_917130 [Suillus clintonianus]|uniref:uncharacterized protein n=1 Tax=Suillus clintonianus TaxID=1904413 RepID=UPI001B85D7BF|nr:uncharacterized protein DEU56DRAFT_917130 [Suillus clintonianus]KAG2124173.1 hypothetical protein DEU56DRAFT_917130 [Suillus clintonianus]